MTNEKICERCRQLYEAYKNINEEPSADVYSVQAAAWQNLQAHFAETGHDLKSVIVDWAGLTREKIGTKISTDERTA